MMRHDAMWRQGALVQLDITDLAANGSAVGRFENRVVFVPNGVPGDTLRTRLVRVRPSYAEGQLTELIQPSPSRIRPPCILAEKCGGCQWQHIDYPTQLTFKRSQVESALQRIGKFDVVAVDAVLESAPFGYRNKVIYPLGRSASGQIKAGYYQKGSHKIVNVNQCPVQDPHLDLLLAQIKSDLNPWEVYNEESKTGALKHLSMRVGQRTGEVLITLVSTTADLKGLHVTAQRWMTQFPSVVGVCLNLNPSHSNRIFGDETRLLHGREYIRELFCGLVFEISSTVFFQINTAQAERMVECILDLLELKGAETVVDGYAGIGTMILPIAKRYPLSQCWAVDTSQASLQCAERNAQLNAISNLQFTVARFEEVLSGVDVIPDVVLLDPPRKGCDSAVLTTLLKLQPRQIVYVSCKPSTLARDLSTLCHSGVYRLERVIPVDLFPQTSHTETVTLLTKIV